MVNETNHHDGLHRAVVAQRQWSRLTTRERAQRMRLVQASIVDVADDLCDLLRLPQRRSKSETLSAELIPLCEALRFLRRRGAEILATRTIGVAGRPLWLWGTRGEVQRDAWGTVLILAPWNYPLFLAGVQAAQALVAGNAVLWKPAPGCEAATATLIDCFQNAVGTDLIQQVDSDPQVATRLMEAGVDKIVLTGSSQTGRAVLGTAANRLTSTTMELSGCDCLIALPEAAIDRVIESIAFGLQFNSGATCIAPRRIFIPATQLPRYRTMLETRLASAPGLSVHPAARQTFVQLVEDSLQRGGHILGGVWDRRRLESDGTTNPIVMLDAKPDWPLMQADVFAPVAAICAYQEVEELEALVGAARYALGASIFGNARAARRLARRLKVGTVTINDLIVPTADPRIPFGGRGESGFGTTRGVEGLLEMTCPRVIMTQKLRKPMHYAPSTPGDAQILAGMLELNFASGWRKRFRGLRNLVAGIRQSSGGTKNAYTVRGLK
ncbi:MAG: aldehyde dehydrogenase family protein [Pirellulaceae bacterium]